MEKKFCPGCGRDLSDEGDIDVCTCGFKFKKENPNISSFSTNESAIATATAAKSPTFLNYMYLAFALLGLVFILKACASLGTGSERTHNTGEQRCWYCSKVIFNSSGTPIHATYTMGDSYTCDYCGHTNVR